ncbi:MAG: hypothetical protein NC226_08790 [Bacteroides cellulosilyticus]|nr:hypothetical protein [Bacteroides cellulosilyticus]
MQDRPDSALAILQQVDRTSLRSRYGKARYALLYSQALDKNYVDVDSDSLITRALNYYLHRGAKRERALAYYYSGRIYENAGNIDSAIVQFTNAEDILKTTTDAALQGLTSGALARLYETQHFIELAENKYLEAANAFAKAGQKRNELFAYMGVLETLSIRNDVENHRLYYDHAVELAKELYDSVSMLRLARTKASKCIKEHSNYRGALRTLKDAANSYNHGIIPQNYYFLLCDIYAHLNKPDSALLYLRPLLNGMQNESARGQLEYLYMASRIYKMKKDDSNAYRYNAEALHICDSMYFAEKEHAIPELQAKYRNERLALHNKYLKSINQYQLIIAIIVLIAVLFISLWLIGRRQKRILQQEQEITEYRSVISRLKEEYEELRIGSNDETLNRRITFLKQLLETTAQFGHNKEAFYAKIEQLLTKSGSNQQVKKSGTNEILLIFQDILNTRHPGIINYLMQTYPQLSHQELSLYCMIAMDISKTAICLVMDTSQKTYYNYRNLLRNKLAITNEEMTIPQHYRMVCEEYEANSKFTE